MGHQRLGMKDGATPLWATCGPQAASFKSQKSGKVFTCLDSDEVNIIADHAVHNLLVVEGIEPSLAPLQQLHHGVQHVLELNKKISAILFNIQEFTFFKKISNK